MPSFHFFGSFLFSRSINSSDFACRHLLPWIFSCSHPSLHAVVSMFLLEVSDSESEGSKYVCFQTWAKNAIGLFSKVSYSSWGCIRVSRKIWKIEQERGNTTLIQSNQPKAWTNFPFQFIGSIYRCFDIDEPTVGEKKRRDSKFQRTRRKKIQHLGFIGSNKHEFNMVSSCSLKFIPWLKHIHLFLFAKYLRFQTTLPTTSEWSPFGTAEAAPRLDVASVRSRWSRKSCPIGA